MYMYIYAGMYVCVVGSKAASDSSNSPTSSVGSYTQQLLLDTDSGHNSITSSNFDTFSTSSNSPPFHKRPHGECSCDTLVCCCRCCMRCSEHRLTFVYKSSFRGIVGHE